MTSKTPENIETPADVFRQDIVGRTSRRTSAAQVGRVVRLQPLPRTHKGAPQLTHPLHVHAYSCRNAQAGQHSHATETAERRASRARDGAETECTATTPWARACRLPARCLLATLQHGAREAIWLTPGPLSKGPAGGAPAPLACPWARALVLGPLPPCDPSARRTGNHLADTGPLEQGSGGRSPAPLACPWARALALGPLPPREPSARRAGNHLADAGPLEQGPGGCCPRSTSVPLGKATSAGAPAWNFCQNNMR